MREPSRNLAGEGQAVEALELYRTEIAKAPPCSDLDFSDLLRRSRDGDEEAGRVITGSHLGMVLALVESLPELPAGLDLMGAVQEANAGLVEALNTFSGTTAAAFGEHARRAILGWLASVEGVEG